MMNATLLQSSPSAMPIIHCHGEQSVYEASELHFPVGIWPKEIMKNGCRFVLTERGADAYVYSNADRDDGSTITILND
jgi:hypothetical protein